MPLEVSAVIRLSDDLLGAEAQLAGALAINVNLQSRVIHVLRHEHVADPGQGAHLLGDLAGNIVRHVAGRDC